MNVNIIIKSSIPNTHDPHGAQRRHWVDDGRNEAELPRLQGQPREPRWHVVKHVDMLWNMLTWCETCWHPHETCWHPHETCWPPREPCWHVMKHVDIHMKHVDMLSKMLTSTWIMLTCCPICWRSHETCCETCWRSHETRRHVSHLVNMSTCQHGSHHVNMFHNMSTWFTSRQHVS